MIGEMWRRITKLLRRARFDRELSEEMRLHRELRERELRESVGAKLNDEGKADEACYSARRRFGNELRLREESRDMWGWRWLEGVVRDLRYGARMLRKNPGFTAVAVLTLALGIGANTAIFSVMESVLWKPLPFPDSERLTFLMRIDNRRRETAFPLRDYLELHSANYSFESMSAFFSPESHNLKVNGSTERVIVEAVTHDFFETLKVIPELGRTFLPGEESAGNNRVAMVSKKTWERCFGADAKFAGQSIVVDGDAYAIVGILPASFHSEHTSDPGVFVPLVTNSEIPTNTFGDNLGVIGRLRAGATLASARIEMKALAARLEKESPTTNRNLDFYVDNLRDYFNGDRSRSLYFFAGAVGLVLLVACVNVAALSLSRMMARQREFAVRAALGAGRGVLARQSLMESLLLGLMGGGLGTLIAAWCGKSLAALLSEDVFARSGYLGVDSRVLVFSFAISIATALLSGVVPALLGSRADLNRDLSSGSRAVSGNAKQRRARSILVIAEITVALVLLFGAGLFVESFRRLSEAPLGFEPNGILSMRMLLRGKRYERPEDTRVFYEQLLDRVRAIPGMRDAALGSTIPMEGSYGADFSIVGEPKESKQETLHCVARTVSPDYFRLLKIRLLAGRDFTNGDQENTQRVAMINENFARHYFGNKNPIGNELEMFSAYASALVHDRIRVQIVGVTENTHLFGPSEIEFDEVFLPSRQQPFNAMYLVAKSDQPSGIVLDEIRERVRALDSDVPVYDVATMDERVTKSLRGARFNTMLVGIFAVMAIVLVSVGIFGAVAYFVQQRTKEFGIRLALGATPARILRHAIQQAATLGAVGLAVGVALSLVVGQIVRSQLYLVPHVHSGLLYGVGIHDPATLLEVCGLLAGVVFFASYIPARRATKVDPMVALRYE
jgi:predicted permease